MGRAAGGVAGRTPLLIAMDFGTRGGGDVLTSSGISEVDGRVTYLARSNRAYHARAGCRCWWSDLEEEEEWCGGGRGGGGGGGGGVEDRDLLSGSFLTFVTEVWFRLVLSESMNGPNHKQNDCSTLKPVFCSKIDL